MLREILVGAAAGAAGTSALGAATYADMAWRGRPASSTPERSIERIAEMMHVRVPGADDERGNRVTGLGALTGLLTGTGVGAAYGLARALGLRMSPAAGAVLVSAAALVAANGPMTLFGITDPRSWSRADWLSDLLPHVAYGAVTAATYAACEK